MKVAELQPGMLIQPVEGMQWVKRQSTLCVEPMGRNMFRGYMYPREELGATVAMYIDNVPYAQREIVPDLEGTWGARVVIVEGSLMAVDQSAWHRIESVPK